MSQPAAGVTVLAAETDPVLEHEADGETYLIRRIREDDVQGFLDLHRGTEFELGGDREWFAWKFEDPPYLAHTPVFIAECGGEVVGARPFMPFRLRVGPRTLIGLQTADTMVHPDHRGRGVFSAMNDLAFAYYRRREPDVLFAMPNDRSRPAYLDMGARAVGPVRNHLRIETPSAFVGEKLGDWAPERTGDLLNGAVRGYLGLRDSRRNGHWRDLSVDRHASIPVGTLAELAESRLPDGFHTHRDRVFYGWRFENPSWEYDAFVATDGGEPIAGAVTGTRRFDGRVRTRISDVVPLAGEERLPGVAALLDRIIETKVETDVFAYAGRGLPSKLLRGFGFQPDDGLLLSPFSNATVLITMPLATGDPEWTVEGHDLSDPDNWQFPFCEQNTG